MKRLRRRRPKYSTRTSSDRTFPGIGQPAEQREQQQLTGPKAAHMTSKLKYTWLDMATDSNYAVMSICLFAAVLRQ